MNIGLLNIRVTIQKNTVLTDRYGNHKNSWSDYFSCYATISGENGKEQAVIGETAEHTDMNATVRWCSETAAVDSTHYRIILGGEAYDILGVDHMNFKRRGIKFQCRKVRDQDGGKENSG